MTVRVNTNLMTLEIDDRVVAMARWCLRRRLSPGGVQADAG